MQLPLGLHTGSRLLGVRVLPSLAGVVTVAAASIASVATAEAVERASCGWLGPARHHAVPGSAETYMNCQKHDGTNTFVTLSDTF